MGLLLCASALSWLGRWQAGLLLCAGWARKRFREEKKETKTQGSIPWSSSSLDSYWTSRGRPGTAKEVAGRLAGGGDGVVAAHRGQGRRFRAGERLKGSGSSSTRSRRELGWSLGATMRWAGDLGVSGEGSGESCRGQGRRNRRRGHGWRPPPHEHARERTGRRRPAAAEGSAASRGRQRGRAALPHPWRWSRAAGGP